MENVLPLMKHISKELHGKFLPSEANTPQIQFTQTNSNTLITITPNEPPDNFVLKITKEQYITHNQIDGSIKDYHAQLYDETTKNSHCGVLPKITNNTITAFCEQEKEILISSEKVSPSSKTFKVQKKELKDDILLLQKAVKKELHDLLLSIT